MPYKIRYTPEAKADRDKCFNTYAPTCFPANLQDWLEALATEAETRKWTISLDLKSLLENMDKVPGLGQDWPDKWERFRSASFIGKLKAAVALLAKRCPPYECRVSVQLVPVFDDRAPKDEVGVKYLIDHAEQELYIIQFFDLPMQDYD